MFANHTVCRHPDCRETTSHKGKNHSGLFMYFISNNQSTMVVGDWDEYLYGPFIPGQTKNLNITYLNKCNSFLIANMLK